MPKFRIEGRADYRYQGKPYSRNFPVYFIAPGQSPIDWRSEKIMSVQQLKDLFGTVNKERAITFLMQSLYADMALPNHRDIGFMVLEVNDWSYNATHNTTILNTDCHDLTVIRSQQLTPHLVELAKAKNISFDGVDPEKSRIVTLQFAGPGFTMS